MRTQLRAYRDPVARQWLLLRAAATQAATLPYLVAGLLLLLGREHALAWVAGGTIAAFAAGVLNAWVLLVEIHR